MHALVLVSFAIVIWSLSPTGSLHRALGLGELAIAVHILVAGERRPQVACAIVLALVAAAPEFDAAGDISAGLALGAVLLSAMRTLPRLPYVIVSAGSLALFAGAQLVFGTFHEPMESVSMYLLVATNTYVAGRLVESLERSTDRLDRTEAGTAAAALRAVEDEARHRAVVVAVQVLHDDVLNALRAAEYGAQLPTAVVRGVCRDAVAAVEALSDGDQPSSPVAGTDTGGYDRLLDELAVSAPLPFEVTYDIEGPIALLSPARLDAAGRALREALRNAERHAGVDHAALRIVSRPGRVSLAVVDEGPGFADTATEGVGISESIRRAVELAGGVARIETSTAGTTVEVVFEVGGPSSETLLARTYQLTTSSGGRLSLVAETMIPLAVVWWPIGGWDALRAPNPVPELLLILAITALPVAVIARLARVAPTTTWLVAFGACLSALQVVGLWLTPDGGLLDLRSWSIGFLATPVIVVNFLVPLRWSLSLIVSQVFILLAALAIHPALSAGAVPVAALNALLSSPLLTVILGLALRRNGRAVERERDRQLVLSADRARRRSLAAVSSSHLDHTRKVVVPWLREVAAGHLDLGSDAVRREARRLAQETRDDLHAPGFHDPRLRIEVSDYRGRGGSVEISPGFAPGAHSRQSGRMLGELVRRLPPVHRIRLSPPGEGASLARLVVTPAPDPALVAELGGRENVHLDGDDLALVLEFEDSVR